MKEIITPEQARELLEELTTEDLMNMPVGIYYILLDLLSYDEVCEIWERKIKLQKAWEQSKKDKLPDSWKHYRGKEKNSS